MRITVCEIFSRDDELCVRFTSTEGVASGFWPASSFAAVLGDSYEVEFDLRGEPFLWGRDIQLNLAPSASTYRIEEAGDGITFVGTVERVEPDGLLFLRVGPSLTMVETEGAAPDAGAWVRLKCPSIDVYAHDQYPAPGQLRT